MSFHKQFRWLYVGFYGFLHIVLAVLLLVTPADAIRQALDNKQIYNVFVIAGAYLLTLMLALILYTTRLYTDNSILKAIPKAWIPIESGDVSEKVRKMVVTSLNQSALIAGNSRPILPQPSATVTSESESRSAAVNPNFSETAMNAEPGLFSTYSGSRNNLQIITSQPFLPIWGEISHEGWSSPLSQNLPNLQYMTVILELPHLIEAKAISLAPSDIDPNLHPPISHNKAMDILQRPSAMGLRDYISHLTALGIVASPTAASEFLSLYEFARFSARPLSEQEFQELMKYFAEILRGMVSLESAMLKINDFNTSESDIDDDANSAATPETPQSQLLAPMHHFNNQSESEGTIQETWS